MLFGWQHNEKHRRFVRFRIMEKDILQNSSSIATCNENPAKENGRRVKSVEIMQFYFIRFIREELAKFESRPGNGKVTKVVVTILSNLPHFNLVLYFQTFLAFSFFDGGGGE